MLPPNKLSAHNIPAAAGDLANQGGSPEMRGRRRVGKSRLVQRFLDDHDVPYLYYQASQRDPHIALERFRRAIERSNLPAASLVRDGLAIESWEAGLRLLGATTDQDKPSVIIIDELPYLVARDPGFEADLQHAWDRVLEHCSILLIAIGSDVAMMERLVDHSSPLFQRPTREMVVPPLTPAEVADLIGVEPADVLDAYLMVGGFPALAAEWDRGLDRRAFLEKMLLSPNTPLLMHGLRILQAEFNDELRAQDVLETIGCGERTFSAVRQRLDLQPMSLTRALKTLTDVKRIIQRTLPLSVPINTDNTRYLVRDPYLRFWLHFLGPSLEEIERGRGDMVLKTIEESWSIYRGKAIEPLVQESIEQMLPDERFQDARYVGGYWNRTNSVEVDLTGIDRMRKPTKLGFIGSIKWRETSPFDHRDFEALRQIREQVPGFDSQTKLIAVSRSGFKGIRDLDLTLGPQELIDAWR